nr:c1q globular head like domain containing protein [uncultured Mediterranean phage uvMED]
MTSKIQAESMNLADTYAFTGTVTGAGGVNTPIVRAVPSSNQSISSSTNTTVVFDTEVIDTDNAFASNTFTVPSGKAGKYYVSVTLITDTNAGDALERVQIKKNTSTDVGYGNYKVYGDDNTLVVYCIVDLSVADTILVNYYPYQNASTIRSNAEYAGGTSINIFKLTE